MEAKAGTLCPYLVQIHFADVKPSTKTGLNDHDVLSRRDTVFLPLNLAMSVSVRRAPVYRSPSFFGRILSDQWCMRASCSRTRADGR
jgi:hypothetical protein